MSQSSRHEQFQGQPYRRHPSRRPGRVSAALAAAAVGLGLVVATSPPANAVTWTAQDRVAASGLAATTETWEASPVDYDGDGDQDVWIGYHDQGGKLWRNNGPNAAGQITYTRVAAAAWPVTVPGVPFIDRHDCRWADIDRNGRPDAYCAAGRGTANGVKNGRDNELWLQTGAGVFTDVADAWNVGTSAAVGTMWR